MRSIEADGLSIPGVERPSDGTMLLTWTNGEREVVVNVKHDGEILVSHWMPEHMRTEADRPSTRQSPHDGPKVNLLRAAIGWLFPAVNDGDQASIERWLLVGGSI